MKPLRSRLSLSRQQVELFYSILLLLVIPGLIVVNTILVSRSVRTDFDVEIRRKADLANTILGSSIKQNLSRPDLIQQTLDDIAEIREDIANSVVVVPDDGEFIVLAAQDPLLRSQTINSLELQLVMDRGQSVAQILNRSNDGSGRSWNVATPVFEGEEIVAITSIDVSIAEAEAAISATLTRSFIVLFITIFLVALLLTNHFRFVQYAQLFNKLKEVDRLKTDFLSVATHELKAPMTIILAPYHQHL